MLVCFVFLHARLRAHRAPGIPCALYFRGRDVLAKLARIARRDRGVVSGIRATSLRAQRSNPLLLSGCLMDCFAALAMTVTYPPRQKPRPAGGTGRGLSVRSAAAAAGPIVQGVNLFDHLNDAAGTRFDQHGLAVHHRVTIRRGAVGLRHVVIGDAGRPAARRRRSHGPEWCSSARVRE